LEPNTTYYWGVRSYNTYGQYKDWSPVWSFSTIIVPPSIPSLVEPANNAFVANNTPTLKWTASTVPNGAPDFDYYRVQVWIVSGGIAVPKIDENIYGRTHTSYTVTLEDALAPNTTYYWGVRSYNTYEQYKDWSPVWSFRTP
jgi:hypothetical protein